MSKIIEHLYTLYNNPFFLSPIIVRFYEKYEGKQNKDILLSYLILPIVLYEESSKTLYTKRNDRSLKSYLNYDRKGNVEKSILEIKKNTKLFGLPDRVQEYKDLTNLCLQYAFDRGCLKVNEDLSISFIKYDFEQDNTLVTFLLASENMARMLKQEKLIDIYRKLGLKNL
jgi:Family of unknown function (DUF6521)